MCYNQIMKRLYYATFESGFGEVVKKIIKKTDRNSQVKTMDDDSVLFFADEHFKFVDSCFIESFVVIQNVHKTGVGALNMTIKTILERKDLKLGLPKDEGTVKFTIKKENENVAVDVKLKTAFEVMIKKITKKGISFFVKIELVLLSKKTGDNLFMRRVQTENKTIGLATKYDFRPETAYMLCFMSEPQPNEVVLDAMGTNGIIAYVRALSFAKANVIVATADEDDQERCKKLAKKLKNDTFSILKYDYLEDNFPIKFIDKIVTDLTGFGYGRIDTFKGFFEKSFDLKIKTIVVALPKNQDNKRFFADKYDILTEVIANKFVAYKLKLKTEE